MGKSLQTQGFESLRSTTHYEQSKSIQLVWYPDSTEVDEMVYWLQSAKRIKGFWTAFHDRDTKEDGTPKKAHFQTAVLLNDELTEIEWSKWLVRYHCPCLQPTNPNGLKVYSMWPDIRSNVRYLRHLDNADKPTYEGLSDIVGLNSDDASKWLDTPIYKTGVKGHRDDPDASIKTKSFLVVADKIFELRLSTFAECIAEFRNDSLCLRFIMQNPYLVRQLLGETLDYTLNTTKNGTVKLE